MFSVFLLITLEIEDFDKPHIVLGLTLNSKDESHPCIYYIVM